MSSIFEGARRLPLHHITIRVPWHDSGWDGHVCKNPLGNTDCLALKGIGPRRRDEVEERCAGQKLDRLDKKDLPPCLDERVSFMAPFPLTRMKKHPYANPNSETHRHFKVTRFVQPAYSAACVPFGWMLRDKVEGNPRNGEMGVAERFQLDWDAEREDMRNQNGEIMKTPWVQRRENQLAFLDTFFGSLRPEESLCFFYAKSTPLSEQSRRVILGVGRVRWVEEAKEYDYDTERPPFRAMIWERNVGHSIRSDFKDGFLFPYQEALALAEREGINPEEFVAFAPDEYFESYSYCSELLAHDGAVASLIACAAALHRIRGRIEGPWDEVLGWINTQLNRLWKARGAFPGLGSALAAFGYAYGFRHGSLLAYDVELLREREGEHDVWKLIDAVMEEPGRLGDSPVAKILRDAENLREGWKRLAPERRALLQILSRCEVSEEQALRFYDKTERDKAGIEVADGDILANPYLLFEQDRRSAKPIAFGTVDRGLFPDDSIREKFPVPEPSCIKDPVDKRRVRALVVDLLEEAAEQGHTLLPRSWVIDRARKREMQPPCPLGEDMFEVFEEHFAPVVARVETGIDEPAYQVDRLAECREIIHRAVTGRRRGRRHDGEHDWRRVVDEVLDDPLPENPDEHALEERARQEKATALEELFRSRLSVLIGPAGTGKTTLLRMLCVLPGIVEKGLLLLAPTGKARVRLEEQTQMRGSGRTLAQFLIVLKRFDKDTGAYFPNSQMPNCSDYRTVIVDECSMLTEEQLAALIDSLRNVERLVLVGDPRQLPPIGAGRPFVDIVKELVPDGVENRFPRCDSGYAELTVSRRQEGVDTSDVLLASHFSGRALEPGVDAAFDEVLQDCGERLRLVQWNHSQDLQEKIVSELVAALGLADEHDEVGFEESLGGKRYKSCPWAFFRNEFGNNPGAARKVEDWQILSPVRAGLVGVDALNRMIQERFRKKIRELAERKDGGRKVPEPMGAQGLLYGDKVINVLNQRRRDVWPKPDGDTYIANGDIGIVVGQYKDNRFENRFPKSWPWKIQVEFANQLGPQYGFSKGEFGDDGKKSLELAYCLTVHKTQGSEFGMSFVVLTNPCWLLSRELLYTALTRHQERLVVLHQGPLSDYRRYADDGYSEIARRMTNLFVVPTPCRVNLHAQERFLEKSLIHRVENGDLVRSKSELVIAEKLYARGIEYAYEQPLALQNGRVRYPDFTIADDARGVVFYWEHLGLLDDPGYRERWERKRDAYLKDGIVPLEHAGADADRILIETRDQSGGGLDATEIARVIDQMQL